MKNFQSEIYPLGATWIEEEGGTNFVIFSENAKKVELLFYSRNNQKYPKEVIEIKNKTGDLWHVFVSGIQPGELYAYRFYGLYKPEEGLRFNHNKVLLDPYAKAISGTVPLKWDTSLFSFKENDSLIDDTPNDEFIPKCVVINPYFNWEDEKFIKRKKIKWENTIIYETHVKGFTKLKKEIPENIRGTYAGLASKQVIEYLKDLGITAIEIMPIFSFIDDKILVDKGLRNYWGYNPINFFSPECRYSSSGCFGEQVLEFKKMVNELHNAEIEVILDVVYNHTGEGNHLGPTLSFKGIDNKAYYLLDPKNPRYYIDYTGVGNTLNVQHPRVIQMILDSLRYWVLEMHVDGFRLDLAPILAREYDKINMKSALMIAIQQDPILCRVKLIAEPWDLGPNGYQLGKFPYNWFEWNDKFRDTFRRFWRGEAIVYEELANRILGSPDIFLNKFPYSSINFITCHDGFTLEDLVSYNQKHNEANCFDNKDGIDDNLSWNCGFEGPTNDHNILNLREKQKRNFMITLMISHGIPMILGGDELSRTQRGNNNAFCQDNEISWYSWDLDERKIEFLKFVKSIIKLRKEIYSKKSNVIWLKQNGEVIDNQSWKSLTNLVYFMIKCENKNYLVILNSGKDLSITLPSGKWELLISSTKSIHDKFEKEILIEEKSSWILCNID